jgi:benzoyl-CoA reductase/2-hydroxyglutaryl-CoA dehydratase subunit BcrC/BadD/HgdB
LVEDVGLAVPLTFVLAWVGGPPVICKGTYATPGQIIADYEMAAGLFHGTDSIVKRLGMAANVMKLDGFIVNYMYNCRPAATLSHVAKKYLEEINGLPVLSLEQDNYDSRAYSAASMRTKVETFAEMLKAKKASVKA